MRLIIVTPDFHRIHHSAHVKETNSNFGFNLSWWDYIFKTYKNQPREGHENMTLGLNEYRDPKKLRFLNLFMMPYDQKGLTYVHIDKKKRTL